MAEWALHALIAALFTTIRLSGAGSRSVSGNVTPPEYWLKSGRPTDEYTAPRAMRFSVRLKLAFKLGKSRRYSFFAFAPRSMNVRIEVWSGSVVTGSGRP